MEEMDDISYRPQFSPLYSEGLNQPTRFSAMSGGAPELQEKELRGPWGWGLQGHGPHPGGMGPTQGEWILAAPWFPPQQLTFGPT